jgi:hypothetical protein
MNNGLNICQEGALDFLSLGALVHRLAPGVIPFRKASQRQIHISGGEFNCAANLSDCFRMNTGIASAMVDYPIGDLIAERVRAMGVRTFYKQFKHNGVMVPTRQPFTATAARGWFRFQLFLRPADRGAGTGSSQPGLGALRAANNLSR